MYPILFQLGDVVIYTYGVVYFFGFLIAFLVFRKNLKMFGFDPSDAYVIYGIAISTGLIGAKILHPIIHTTSRITSSFENFLVSGGMYYGGLFMGIISVFLVAHFYYRRFGEVIDAVGPSIAFGHAVGRLGCFFAGCCYGSMTSLPWAIEFHSKVANAITGVPLGIPLHPVQLYESGLEILLGVFLMKKIRTKTGGTGMIWGGYMVGYGVIRFFTEYFRGVPKRMVLPFLNANQILSIILAVSGGIIIYVGWKYAYKSEKRERKNQRRKKRHS